MRKAISLFVVLILGLFLGSFLAEPPGELPPNAEQLVLVDSDYTPSPATAVSADIITADYQLTTNSSHPDDALFVFVPKKTDNGMTMYIPYPVEKVDYRQRINRKDRARPPNL